MHDQELTRYSLAHLSDAVLVRELKALVVGDRIHSASLLAHLGEVDARKLHVPAGYPSMFSYCTEALHFSEGVAYKRIQAARIARTFPRLLDAVADGRLHLTAVCLLAPHLTADNVDEMIAAATHKGKSDIEEWIARHCPTQQFSMRTASVRVIPAVPQPPAGGPGPAPQLGFRDSPALEEGSTDRPAPEEGSTEPLAPEGSPRMEPDLDQVRSDLSEGVVDREKTEPAQAEPPLPRFLVRLTIEKATHDKLRRAQALLSHSVHPGDVAQVLDRALDALIDQLEKQRLGAARPRTSTLTRSPSPKNTRYVPAHVRRAVWERDQGRCTYVGPDGHRCTARRVLQFDHIEPVARGGRPTVEGLRLRCRAHNQLEAERAFGADFMRRKRLEARLAAEEAKSRAKTNPKNNSPPSA